MMNQRMQLLICGGTGCTSARSEELKAELDRKLAERGIEDITVTMVGCFGFCGEGPIVKVQPDNVFYVKVAPEDVDELIESHVLKGRIVERLLFIDPEAGRESIITTIWRFMKSNTGLHSENAD